MIAAEMEKSIQTELLNKWYPQSVDKEHGGFLSSFNYDFKPFIISRRQTLGGFETLQEFISGI